MQIRNKTKPDATALGPFPTLCRFLLAWQVGDGPCDGPGALNNGPGHLSAGEHCSYFYNSWTLTSLHRGWGGWVTDPLNSLLLKISFTAGSAQALCFLVSIGEEEAAVQPPQ